MAFANPRDAGKHFEEKGRKKNGNYEVKLDPSPVVKTPGQKEWRYGCELLGLDPEDGLSEQPAMTPYPGDTSAERFMGLALKNADEYDLLTMPKSYAGAILGAVFTAWAQHYIEQRNQSDE